MSDETQDMTGQDQTTDQTTSGQAGGADEKSTESPKTYTPKAFAEMSEAEKAVYGQAVREYHAHLEQEAAKKAKASPAKSPAKSNEDANDSAEREVEKLINQAFSEAGEGADGKKLLTKAMTKMLMTSTGLTKAMVEEIAEQKIAGLRGAIVDSQAERFFHDYDYLEPVKDKMRIAIEKHGVPVDVLMDIVEGIRPKTKAKSEDDEDYERESSRKTPARDDWDFLMETPSKRGDSSSTPTKSRTDAIKDAAKAAVAAQETGDIKARDAALKRYLRLRPRAA